MDKIIQLVPDSIDKALEPSLSTLGKSMNSVFLSIFMPFLKLGIKKEVELEEYAKLIRDKVSSIPSENIAPPPLHIAGPLLEASKYYIESFELRDMFATLLASSMDIRKSHIVHPSYVEIIKQLSPFDARFIKECGGTTGFTPTIDIKLKSRSVDPEAHRDSFINVFMNFIYTGLQNEKNSFTSADPHMLSCCLNNLNRLGIIKINETMLVSHPSCYQELWSHPSCKAIINQHLTDSMNEDPNCKLRLSDYAYTKGSYITTSFGLDFFKACVEEF